MSMKNWKNITKRGLSLFIALVMCMSCMSLTAFAGDEDVVEPEPEVTETAEQDTNPTVDIQPPDEPAAPVEDNIGEEETTVEVEKPADMAMATSFFSVSAKAAAYIDSYIFSTNEDLVDPTNSSWAKAHKNTIDALSLTIDTTPLPLTPEGNGNLWIYSPDMVADGTQNDTSITPYFYEYQGTEKIAKYVLKEVIACPGGPQGGTITGELTIQPSEIASVDITKLQALADKDSAGYSSVCFYFVWTLKGLTEGEPAPEVKEYTIHYTLNKGDGEGQLPESVGVEYDNVGNYSLKDTNDPGRDNGLKDQAVMEGNTVILYPRGHAPDPGPASVFKTTDVSYGLIGWKCEDSACGKTEDHPLHQVGDEFTATAAAANGDTTITLSAQWEHKTLPTPEEMAERDNPKDPPLLKLANPNRGDPIVLTQHILQNGKPVTDELELDPKTCEIYYEATTWMSEDVAEKLGHPVQIPWGGGKFAQFQIQVQMDSKLSLVDEDKDGFVEFTFTCPFLRPVKGQEVLVGGEPTEIAKDEIVYVGGTLVEGVEVTDTNPYTYRVPVIALQDADGIHPFTIVVEWNGMQGFEKDVLMQPITLATARAKTDSKLDLKTTGTVTGWIAPQSGGVTPNGQSLLGSSMLSNSPSLRKYLIDDLHLSSTQATQAMLNYMDSEAAHAVCKLRSILSANTVTSWAPCKVEFYDVRNVNGELVETLVETQDELRASNKDTAKNVEIPAFSANVHFAGWYTAKEGGDRWEFETPVTNDLKLYARWHTYGDWTVTTSATCTEDGLETRTCMECDETQTQPITAPGHTFAEGWATDGTNHWHACTVCGERADTAAHTYGDWTTDGTNHWHVCTVCGERADTAAHTYPDTWTVRTPATTTARGEEYRDCTACGHEVTRPIAQLPVTPVIPPVTPPVTPVTPPTVDPGTNIPDTEVPLANVSGLNNVDHFAYIAGYEDGTVRPTNNITRAEVATIFFRLMTEEYRVANWSTSNTFTDANPSGWYNAAISTAARAGILKGYADGSVKPNANITRAEFAAIAARFISDDVTDDGVGDFSDTANHWAAKEIRLAAKAGWVQGDGGRFRPDDPITRAEVMVLVNRMLDRIPDADHMLPGMKTWSDNPAGTWYYAAVQEATNDHAYERAEDGVSEIWTELTEAKDWTALEAEWAANNGASAPKAETPSEDEAA